MTASPDPSAYWDALSAEEQGRLDRIAQRSVYGLAAYPADNQELIFELLEWLRLENDVLKAHGDWLARTKAQFESRGIPWTTDELVRRAHLWEHE